MAGIRLMRRRGKKQVFTQLKFAKVKRGITLRKFRLYFFSVLWILEMIEIWLAQCKCHWTSVTTTKLALFQGDIYLRSWERQDIGWSSHGILQTKSWSPSGSIFSVLYHLSCFTNVRPLRLGFTPSCNISFILVKPFNGMAYHTQNTRALLKIRVDSTIHTQRLANA